MFYLRQNQVFYEVSLRGLHEAPLGWLCKAPGGFPIGGFASPFLTMGLMLDVSGVKTNFGKLHEMSKNAKTPYETDTISQPLGKCLVSGI